MVSRFGLESFLWPGKQPDFPGMEIGAEIAWWVPARLSVHYVLSHHAEQEMARRGIPRAMVESVMDAPEQRVPGHGEIMCRQSRIEINGKTYLLRVMVNETSFPPVVVTVYRTGRIEKYWEAGT